MQRITLLATAAIAAATAWAAPIETRAHYSTNADGAVGKNASITIDGEFGDWSEDMIIATCGANDMATAFKGSHENCVLDAYALYAAWDDANLYIAWQMCNTGDTWAREGDGPLTDYGRIGNVPLILALSIDPSKPGMTGLLEDGRCIWCDNAGNGTTFDPAQLHVDRLLFMSGQAGQGTPAIFSAVNAAGATNYGSGCVTFANAGITYKMKEGFHPSHLWRQRTTAEWVTPTELVSDPSIINNIYDPDCYDNLLAGPVEGLKTHDTAYDSFYEIKIPFAALGITRQWLEANGIGCRMIATRGESAIDCIPFDPSMVDNTFGEYGKDNSTTHEKDDLDVITYAMADIAKVRDLGSVDPLPDPDPEPEPEPEPEPGTEPEPAPDGAYIAYFDDSTWSAVFTYVWDKGNADKLYAGNWPGSSATKVSINARSMWQFSFSTDDALVTPMIIWNNGSGGTGNQTDDFEFVNHGVYTMSGFSGETIADESSVADITADGSHSATYYNLMGCPVANPSHGIFIRHNADGSTSKVRL